MSKRKRKPRDNRTPEIIARDREWINAILGGDDDGSHIKEFAGTPTGYAGLARATEQMHREDNRYWAGRRAKVSRLLFQCRAELEAERAKLTAATRENESLRADLARENQRIAELQSLPGSRDPELTQEQWSAFIASGRARYWDNKTQAWVPIPAAPPQSAQPGVRCFVDRRVSRYVWVMSPDGPNKYTYLGSADRQWLLSGLTIIGLLNDPNVREITPAEALQLIPDEWPEGQAELRRLIGEVQQDRPGG